MNSHKQRKRKHVIMGLIAAAILTPLGQAQQESKTWFVDDDGPDPTTNPDGLGWPQAFQSLETALSVAVSGDTIFVGQGTYKPGSSGKFEIKNKNIIIEGGYWGLDAPVGQRDDRDVDTYETILSGDADNNDVNTSFLNDWNDVAHNGNLSAFIEIENVSHFGSLDGFTIEGGRSPEEPDDSGFTFAPAGAMTIVNSSIDIVRCTFRFNSSGRPADLQEGDSGRGGAVSVSGRDLNPLKDEPVNFINCTFHDNVASSGGAIAMTKRGSMTNDEPTLVKVVNSLFHDNRALRLRVEGAGNFEGSGGAIFVVDEADVDIVNCTFTH